MSEDDFECESCRVMFSAPLFDIARSSRRGAQFANPLQPSRQQGSHQRVSHSWLSFRLRVAWRSAPFVSPGNWQCNPSAYPAVLDGEHAKQDGNGCVEDSIKWE